MEIINRLEKFQKAHDEALENINSMLNTDKDYEQDFKLLIRWLMETEINPYSILPECWAGSVNDAVSFEGLCRHIHHAMVDDGEIEFITVNDEPRIVFVGAWEEKFEDRVLTEQEYDMKYRGYGGRSMTFNIVLLEKNVQKFIEARLAFDIADLRRCFEWDAADGLEHAIKHYGDNPLFKTEWIVEVENSTRYKHRKALRQANGKD
jgi:hypothetical protein